MDHGPVVASKTWKLLCPDPDLERELAGSLPVSGALRRILLNRGLDTRGGAMRFLNPDLDDLHDPGFLHGIDRAVVRTRKALQSGEKIMVHGDYDVDGVTSAVLLIRILRALQADVTWYVPHRQREGYDIRTPAVDAAKKRGVGLIITADCGTSAAEAVEYASSLGIDTIVTDHHEPGDSAAPALAVLNPRKPECAYPFKDLAGVGVAFKFAEALVSDLGYDVAAFRRRFVDLVAIGTVADSAPLLGENRTLVKFGMEEIPRSGKLGIRALLTSSGMAGRPITSHMLGFVLAPRLNAAGRIDDASVALELLLSKDAAEAQELAGILEVRNKERQTEQERMTREALEQIASRGLDQKAKVLVLSSKGWHPGIVGIVASKIVDHYSRPAVLLAVDETGEAGVGSARSIGSFDLFEALVRCRHLLERCGGHARAAGLSISTDRLTEFDTAINGIADEVLAESDLVPQLEIDVELDLDDVTRDLAEELCSLEPCGYCNREPVFMSRRALVLRRTRMGGNRAHLKLEVGSSSGRSVECVAFGWGEKEEAFRLGSLVDLCYNIRLNDYSGLRTVQLVLQDMRSSDAAIGGPASPGT